MTVPTRIRSRSACQWRHGLGICALVVAVGLAGCKDKGTSGGLTRHDPLMGRIPPQNVPVPDRGTAGGKKTDPLVAPTGRNEKTAGAGYTDDPQRFKGGPFIPSEKSVPAALASRPRDGDELKIESPGVMLQPIGGTTGPELSPDLAGADGHIQQLRTYGLANGNYSFDRSTDGYIFRATLPVAGGANRGYTGAGPTPADAVKQVLDQVKADRGK